MRVFLTILGILLLGIVALFVINPLLVLITRGKMPDVKAKAEIRDDAVLCILTLVDAKSSMFVTSLDVPRSLAEKTGLGAPDGFKEEPMQDRRSDPDWTAKWNSDNIRFVGKLRIEPDAPLVVRFPFKTVPRESLKIQGLYESGRKFGNLIGGFYVEVGKQ